MVGDAVGGEEFVSCDAASAGVEELDFFERGRGV